MSSHSKWMTEWMPRVSILCSTKANNLHTHNYTHRSLYSFLTVPLKVEPWRVTVLVWVSSNLHCFSLFLYIFVPPCLGITFWANVQGLKFWVLYMNTCKINHGKLWFLPTICQHAPSLAPGNLCLRCKVLFQGFPVIHKQIFAFACISMC